MSKKISRSQWALIAGGVAIVAIFSVVYWSSFRMLLSAWEQPDYSHGYLIPFFSLFLLWFRRDLAPRGEWTGSWWGAVLIALSGVLYVAAGMMGFNLIIAFSIIPCVAGIVLMLGGWPMMRWCWPSVVFLCFMIPLPMALETMARVPLQRLATLASTYLLQTLSLPAVARGNVIQLSEYPINVAEACSGLRMLMTSVALTCGLAFVLDRPIWERLFVLASAIPIALGVNVIRVAVTGLCHELFGVEVAEKVFHDVAGYIMPALAVLMLWLEIEILRRLTIDPEEGPSLAGALAPR
ncbi:MAG: exosortase/archaeosortase family protein [Planctomycetota bacterium]